MRKKFNQLKQEHGESGAGQCKWPWFERCLMIWGKDCQGLWHCWRHGQWCSNWFGGWICAGACQLGGYWRTWCSSFSKQTCSSICRQLFSRQWRGRQLARERLDGAAKKVGRLKCMCAFWLAASLSASEFQGAGRQKPRFSQSCTRPPRERERERSTHNCS
jgi:hypothetical protein